MNATTMTLALKGDLSSVRLTHPSVENLALRQTFSEDDEVGAGASIILECEDLRKLKIERMQDQIEEIVVESGNQLQYCKFREVRGINKVRFCEGVAGIRKIEIERCGVDAAETRFEFA
jgi:hypothetical protein